jgi:predicted PurR-regulated permease PerM
MPASEGDRQATAPVGGQLRRLRFTARSLLVGAVVVALGLIARGVVAKSTRVLGWLLAATVVAALLQPIVDRLGKHMKRGLALLLVLVGVGGLAGSLVYATIHNLQTEANRLKAAAPEAAQRIEASQRFGRAARDFHLTERVTDFVNGLPARITGGGSTAAIRSTATRGLAYVAGTVLTIFLLLHGPRILRGGLRQVRDVERRARIEGLLLRAYGRAWRYIVGTVGKAVLVGLLAYAAARATKLPGSIVLGMIVALLSAVPLVGILVGSVPLLLLSLGFDPGGRTTAVLLVLAVAYQLLDGMLLQPRLEANSVHLGPAITLVVGMVCFELIGLSGALYGLALTTFLIAIGDELAPSDEHAIDLTDLVPPPEDQPLDVPPPPLEPEPGSGAEAR